MNKKNIYKVIAVAVVATGTFGLSSTSVFAKTNHTKLVKKVKLSHEQLVRGKNGAIYSNYKLNKVVSNLKKHKSVIFKTKQKYIIKDQKGKKHTYSLIKHKKLKGVALSNKLKLVKVKKTVKHSKKLVADSVASNNVTNSNNHSSNASSSSAQMPNNTTSSAASSTATTTNNHETVTTIVTPGTSLSSQSTTSTYLSNGASLSSSTSSSANSASSSAKSSSATSSASSNKSNSASSSAKSSSATSSVSSNKSSSASSSAKSSSATSSASSNKSNSASSSAKSSSATSSASSNNSNSASSSAKSSSATSSASSNNSNSASSSAKSSSATSSAGSNNSSSASSAASNNASNGELANYFTSSEISQINEYKSEAAAIGNGNSDSDVYDTKPNVNGTFNIGKLSQNYIDNSVKWVNFFRSMLHLKPLTNSSDWNTEAQYGAAALDALNTNLKTDGIIIHELPVNYKPSYVSDQDWQRANNATKTSNLGYSVTFPPSNSTPYKTVTGFLNDGDNLNASEGPGHREWLIGNVDKIGIGYSRVYSDYKLFNNNSYDDSIVNQNPVNFPGDGLFPIDLVKNTSWSVSVPTNFNNTTVKPAVTVYDNTDKKAVSVSDVNINGRYNYSATGFVYGSGYFGSNVWFTPDASAIKVNHSYTITVNNLPGYSQPYTYTTKLFDLGINDN
ncbi:hypothetical protein [Lactobacillus sp. Sy-1]|uniref:hypothetical protein n=1 Tax=Lactobacillus sp. Sy-1 TaxID=2109645 RepID=UPI001C56759D|nr:hypothetical protein [Lactobacillus sp. Sy-1]MBW1604841.1 hypothetical protein [Lactobacillus sp. Sy-1]